MNNMNLRKFDDTLDCLTTLAVLTQCNGTASRVLPPKCLNKLSNNFYILPFLFSQGDFCPYRHEPSALGCETMCTYWQQGNCLNEHCNFRHIELKVNNCLPAQDLGNLFFFHKWNIIVQFFLLKITVFIVSW